MAGPHHLGGKVDEFATNRRGVAANGQDVLQIILFEALKQKEAHDHQVIVGLIGGKALERELLAAKLFQATMRQFIGATLMVVEDQTGIFLPVFLKVARHLFQNRLAGSQIGQDDVVRPGKGQQALLVLVLWASIEGPVRSRPLFTLVGETGVTPYLPSVVIFLPLLLGKGSHLVLDGFEGLAGGKVEAEDAGVWNRYAQDQAVTVLLVPDSDPLRVVVPEFLRFWMMSLIFVPFGAVFLYVALVYVPRLGMT